MLKLQKLDQTIQHNYAKHKDKCYLWHIKLGLTSFSHHINDYNTHTSINYFIMFSTQFWLIVIGIAQAIGCSWIHSKFQERSYKRDIRSRHSYVLLAILLAEEEKLICSITECNEDGTGEVYLSLPQGIVKVFSHDSERFAISLVGAVIINDIHADMARELCKELNSQESRIRYSVSFEPTLFKTVFSITCDFEGNADDEYTEYDILSYAQTYLVPKQQELQTLWKSKTRITTSDIP